ncbi:YHS domain-containing (seleno)protein [Leptospira adleri]|uniref:YHS domain protein n=1 Tax=Leptospira adleri TaxID=2023186 RepID=A0A2M9YRR6_9LEPT|nr:YHS domain-containing (seleno)protein [Leptospira adleri]PJZ54217.1 YHS domain protein [Leptospira adleri]PJZ62377.1 YHS domain protein [Leptospira adleri]TGM52939.1 YHS domain-containing protein [Leptospira adleri]
MKKNPFILILLLGISLEASPINKTFWKDLAINGYDPVAYFTLGKPIEGKKEFQLRWMDADWRFSSAENLKLFREHPERFAPQFGGYCAYGVAFGEKVSIDPKQWKIVDGKLYLNYDRDVQVLWEKDIPGWIEKARKEWESVKKK